jgi:pantothenate kinase
MRTIYKYPVDIGQNMPIKMPKGAVVLDVQAQDGQPSAAVAWALVETNNEAVDFQFVTVGTGHQIPEFTGINEHNYVGTFQTSGGRFVWHVFGGEVQR